MLPLTRIGDTTSGICDLGIPDCCPHGRAGINQSGSPDVLVNGIPLHRLSDTGPCRCPHGGTFRSVAGSGTVLCNGLPVTRVSDSTSCVVCGCSGSHVNGSPNVLCGA